MPKIIIPSNKENYEAPKVKRYKAKAYVESEDLKLYIIERDRVIWRTTKDEQTKQALRERYKLK